MLMYLADYNTCSMHTRAGFGEQEALTGSHVQAEVLSAVYATSTAVIELCNSQPALTLHANSLWQGSAGKEGCAF